MHWTISLLVLYSATCEGSHHVEEECGNNKKTHFTDEQKETLMEIMSKQLLNSTKVEVIEINERFSHCVSLNFKDSSKSVGWNSSPAPASPPACVSVGSQCSSDWRKTASEFGSTTKDGVYKSKDGWWSSPPGWHSPTQTSGWSSSGWSSSTQSKTCCNQDICTNSVCCTPTPAYSNHSVCTQNSHCCGYSQGKSVCDTTSGICKLRLSVNCTASNQCINENCNNGTCCIPNGDCQPLDSTCSADNQCCNGTCVDGKCNSKEGSPCCGQDDCVLPLMCMNNMCCISGSTPCTPSSPCCEGSCNTEINMCSTCRGLGQSCSTTDRIDNCCDGRTCVGGICKNNVMSGPCSATDACVPPSESMCQNGMCCTKSNSACTSAKPCCAGQGLCNVDTQTCVYCGAVGDDCNSFMGVSSCCPGRQCTGAKCRKDVTSGPCSEFLICQPAGLVQCQGGMCCATPGVTCSAAVPCCTGTCPTKQIRAQCPQ